SAMLNNNLCFLIEGEGNLMRRIVVLSAVLTVCVGLCSSLLGQGGTAQISGTAKDQTGAFLPGVQVTATQTETGVVRSTVTNETGFYALPDLPVGPYRLESALPGFRTFIQTGIVLQ